MKKVLLILMFITYNYNANAQTCEEIMEFVKSESRGVTYSNYNSKVISKVTFYTVTVDYKTMYFAIVCFKKEYSYSCSEYIYQVGSNTQYNYSLDHYNSAGKAFWEHIEPYSDNLDCGPNFD